MATETVKTQEVKTLMQGDTGNTSTTSSSSYKVEINSLGDNNERIKKYNFYQNKVSIADELNTGIVTSLSHKQKMYQPSSLEVKLQITNNKFNGSLIGNLISLYDNTTLIAKDYFIFSEKKNSSYLMIEAYSADYFLTIDKFCQAFTAKTLVEEIITPCLNTCSSPNFEKFRSIVKYDKEVKEKKEDGEENKNVEIKKEYILKNLVNFLSDSKETIIPYAVQYNESFYDFMVRMCNRDGEFLYLDENNNLCIGLKPTSITKTIDSTFSDGVKEYVNSYDIEDSSSWINKNYLGKSFTTDGKTVEEKKTDEGGYIYDFNLKKKDDSDLLKQYYILAPEYLEDVSQKSKYAKWEDYTCAYSQVISKLHAFGDERNIMDAVTLFGLSWGYEEGVYKAYEAKENKEYTGVYGNIRALYSTDKTLRTNEKYKEVYKNQEKSERGQLTIHSEIRPNIQLGEVIGDYVVYSFNKMVCDNASSYKEEYEVSLVKKGKDNFYPLPMPEKHIRKSSAQRAIVVDNFDPSRLGRVRVRYPWQISSDVNTTPWIRISNPMASNGAGFLFTPDVNDEVLIDYEDGNIERPYVCGAFYNNTNRPSIASQSQMHGKVKSITSANGHHISFTDTGGSKRCASSIMPLTKTLSTFGVMAESAKTDNDEKYWGGGFEIADYYGVYSITGSTHNRSININSPMGNISMNALTGITISAPLGDVKIVGKNVSIEARNNLSIESGTNIKGYLEFFKRSEYKGLDDNPVLNLLNAGLSGGIVDLGLIRNVFEMLVRPIGGTLKIKSNRYMHLEAGDGETNIEKNPDNSFFRTLWGSELQTKNGEKYKEMYEDALRIRRLCDKCRDNLIALVEVVKISEPEVKQLFKNIFKGDKNIKAENELRDEIIQLQISFTNYEISDRDYGFLELRRSFDYMKKHIDIVFNDEPQSVIDYKNRLWDKIVTWANDTNGICDLSEEIDINKLFYDKIKSFAERNLRDSIEVRDLNDFSSFDSISAAIIPLEKKKTGNTVLSTFLKLVGIKNLVDGWDDRVWTTRDKGAILFSDKKGKHFKLGDDGNLKTVYTGTDRDEILMYFQRLQKLNA